MDWIIWWILLAVILCPLQFVVAAPYGRHTSKSWGPVINSKLGWVLMELVSLAGFSWMYFTGSGRTRATLFIAALFILHYIHRSIIYPLMTRTGKKTIPLMIVLFAVAFNVVNGYINGEYLGNNPGQYPDSYFTQWNFILGLAMFIGGAAINMTSDYYLISLRKSNTTQDYQIPLKGLFRFVSCPNLFGEIVEWTGFAILCWNLPAVAFAVWTVSNLVPRAYHHHKWYKQKFADYPKNRKAVIPGVF